MIPTEHQEQSALLQWWGLYSKIQKLDPKLLFAIPNAAKRSYKLANAMRSEGLRSGVPDLFLALPRGLYHGMFIEMKRQKGGRVSQAQSEYMKTLHSAGYVTTVCEGFESARARICDYIENTNALEWNNIAPLESVKSPV